MTLETTAPMGDDAVHDKVDRAALEILSAQQDGIASGFARLLDSLPENGRNSFVIPDWSIHAR